MFTQCEAMGIAPPDWNRMSLHNDILKYQVFLEVRAEYQQQEADRMKRDAEARNTR